MSAAFDYHPAKQSTFVMHQDTNCVDCLIPPPLGCLQKGCSYQLIDRKQGKPIGFIKENPGCFCKTCCMPCARTSTTDIEFFGKKYTVVKGF